MPYEMRATLPYDSEEILDENDCLPQLTVQEVITQSLFSGLMGMCEGLSDVKSNTGTCTYQTDTHLLRATVHAKARKHPDIRSWSDSHDTLRKSLYEAVDALSKKVSLRRKSKVSRKIKTGTHVFNVVTSATEKDPEQKIIRGFFPS